MCEDTRQLPRPAVLRVSRGGENVCVLETNQFSKSNSDEPVGPLATRERMHTLVNAEDMKKWLGQQNIIDPFLDDTCKVIRSHVLVRVQWAQLRQ